MRSTIVFLSSLLTVLSVNATPSTVDSIAGKQKSYTCQFCHGATGRSPRSDYPHIDGQNAEYLYQAMKAYQDGNRTGPFGALMKQQLSPLNDQDLADIAAFYAEQKSTAN